MSRISQTGLAAHKTPAPTATGGKHFDTFETKFFEQGEAGDGERFDDLDDSHYAPRHPPLRWFLLGAAAGGLLVAVLGGATLWLSGVHLGQPAPEATAAKLVPAEPAGPAAAPAPAVPAAPAAAPAVVAAEPAAPAAAAPPPTPTAAVVPAPTAAVVAAPVVPAVLTVPGEPAPAPPAPAPSAPLDKPVIAALPGLGPLPAPPVASADPSSARCRKAIDGKRGKDILAACPAAFAAEPTADTAVALAKIEFDRGRAGKALEWGKKAVALDANVADAYVFIGGGEQMAGHDKAAKDAYRRYLELAPTGRYARDVRSIVGSAK